MLIYCFFIAIFVGFAAFDTVREIVFLVRHKNCKMNVTATVTSLRESSRGRYGSKFKATVSYELGGQHYSEELNHSYRYQEMSEGERVTVLVNEKKPSVMLEPRERKSAIMRIFAMPAAVILLVTSLILKTKM